MISLKLFELGGLIDLFELYGLWLLLLGLVAVTMSG